MLRAQRRLWAVTVTLVLMAAAMASTTGIASAARKPVASVLSVKGQLVVKRSSASKFVSLARNGALYPGDVVGTGPRSKAKLLFNNYSQLGLNANSAVRITAPVSVGKGKQSFAEALSGEVWARLRPGQAVRTPGAVLGVMGTEVNLRIADDGTTTLMVVEGEVQFFNPFGEVVVKTSQQSTARPGSAPTAPVTIQTPGLIIEWTLDLNLVVLQRESSPATLARQSPAIREGYAALDDGQPDAAEAAFQNALPESPVAARLGLAWLALARGQNEPAGSQAAEALLLATQAADTAGNAEASLLSGLADLRTGRTVEAIDKLQYAASFPPTILSSTPDPLKDEALNSIRAASQAWLALAYLAQDDREAALKAARAAVRLTPDSALAHSHLALVYFHLGQPEPAVASAKRALRKTPEIAAARVVLAQALLADGDVSEAVREAAYAVALDPGLPQAHYVLGLAEIGERQYSHATRELREALRLAPNYIPAASALARVYNLTGQHAAAIATIRNLNPSTANADSVRAALAAVFYEQGRYPEAIAEFREAARLRPGSALYQAGLARVLLDDNRLNEALIAGQNSVFLAPEVGQYHAQLGLIAKFSGLTAFSERELRTAIALDPDNSLARAELAFLSPDARTSVSAFAQAFLYDPALERQLLRGGVNLELSAVAGTPGIRTFLGTHRWQGLEGKAHAYGYVYSDRTSGKSNLPNDTSVTNVNAENLTYILDNRTNLYLGLTDVRYRSGVDGPDITRDDSSRSLAHDAVFAARRRVGDGHQLWFGAVATRTDSVYRDPDANSQLYDTDGIQDRFSGTERSRSHGIDPEVRFDFALNRRPGKKTTFTIGHARSRQRYRSRDRLVLPPATEPETFADTTFIAQVQTTYFQLAQRLNPKLSYIAQLRRRDLQDRFIFAEDGDAYFSIADRNHHLRPSLLVNYQHDRKTTLRFFANHNDFQGVEAFAPLETLLAGEPLAKPSGFSNDTRLLELDIERYLSPRRFAKVFLFKSEANGLGFSGGTRPGYLLLRKAERTGIGLRYEQQLNRNLFANLQAVHSRTRSAPPTKSFDSANPRLDGQEAPYQPSFTGSFALNYVDPRGNKASVTLSRVGSFFQDSPADIGPRPRFPAKTTLDLTLAREPSLKNEVFLNILNVFNAEQISFQGYRTGGRRIEVGWTRRF